MADAWRVGRGKLGGFAPLIGRWRAEGDSPRGKFACERTFASILSDKYVELDVVWSFASAGPSANYEEHAVFGVKDGVVSVWSFTSDGKRSEGVQAAAPDIHPKALCFESQMPAGLARQIYWPNPAGGLLWAVEARNRSGWKRFTEHDYKRRK